MDFLRNFIMVGIRDMIDKGVALYQTYQYASGWFSKSVLTQEDLQEIETLYEEKAQKELEEIQREDANIEENVSSNTEDADVQVTDENETIENESIEEDVVESEE